MKYKVNVSDLERKVLKLVPCEAWGAIFYRLNACDDLTERVRVLLEVAKANGGAK